MGSKFVVKKGQILFAEGGFSDCAYIIESGKLEISKRDKNGGKKVVGVLSDSEIVGEMGLIDGSPRSATATALENTTVSIISKDHFENLYRSNPRALMPILKVLTVRLRNTSRLVLELGVLEHSV
ncbi:MAG: hypothetical protein A3K09_00115 [Nitrospinae bacterium RIFCSPLOWO2_12_FULL_47_7]|nr:MAG: hypothetical protein A3K09_00115 [Nitrospinae bacterium RIFCSPLOWO2_12_FULL_47_7]